MCTDDFGNVLSRIGRVERQNRNLGRALASALALGVALLLMGVGTSKKTIEADEFVLRDTNGKVRIMLGSFPDGVGLKLADTSGAVRMWVGMSERLGGDPVLTFADREGWYATLVGSQSGAELALNGSGPTPGVGLYARKDGSRGIELFHSGGRIAVGEKITGYGKTGAAISLAPNGDLSLKLMDKEDKVLFKAP
jgi:hypothetical protein